MIDLAEAAAYRGFALNTVTSGTGCLLEQMLLPGVSAVGYTEKRARADGTDAGDVYQGARRFTLRGTIYGATRGALFDQYRAIIAAFTATRSYDDDADALGYQPFTFSSPTADTANFPSGAIDLFINIRPLAQPSFEINRDTTGGDKGGGLPWSVPVEARDPRFYVATPVEVALTGATSGSGTMTNRGNYPTRAEVIVVSNAATAQTLHLVAGDADVTITVPSLADGPSTITLGSDPKVVTLDYLGNQTYRPDLISWAAQRSYPTLAPGDNAYSWTLSSAQLASGSLIRYYEAFA